MQKIEFYIRANAGETVHNPSSEEVVRMIQAFMNVWEPGLRYIIEYGAVHMNIPRPAIDGLRVVDENYPATAPVEKQQNAAMGHCQRGSRIRR